MVTCETKIEQNIDISRLSQIDSTILIAHKNSNPNLALMISDRAELVHLITKGKFAVQNMNNKVSTLVNLYAAAINSLVLSPVSWHTYFKKLICEVKVNKNTVSQNGYELSASIYIVSQKLSPDSLISEVFDSLKISHCDIVQLSPIPTI